MIRVSILGFLVLLLASVSCFLRLLTSHDVNGANTITNLEYQLVPIGKQQFGREIDGRYTAQNSDGCSGFTLTSFDNDDIPLFTSLPISSCSPTLQAYNAQNSGASLLILVVDSSSTPEKVINQIYAQSSYKVVIPVLLMTSKNFEVVKKQYSTDSNVFMGFGVEVPHSNNVNLELYLFKDDAKTLAHVASVEKYIQHMNDQVKFKLTFFEDPIDTLLLKETQSLMNCLDTRNSLNILNAFANNCIAKSSVTVDCLTDQIYGLGHAVKKQAKQCVDRNTNMSEVSLWPVGSHKKSFILINGVLYNGRSKQGEDLFDAICSGFIHSPPYCIYIDNKYQPNVHLENLKEKAKKHKILTILAHSMVSLLIVGIFGFVLFVLYQKIYQRILNERVADIVRDSVINYSSLRNNE